jgi:Protein of unknown function (DUF3575)
MNKKSWLPIAYICCLFVLFHQNTAAQDKNSLQKDYKNNVHFNISNPLIFGGKSYVFGYERVINNRQSFSVNAGLTSFPDLGIIGSDSMKMKKVLEEGGMNISADYRFYLSKVNKDAAPRGVYIGPYCSYNHFKNKNAWSFTDATGFEAEVNSELKMNVFTAGFELGYQFVLWNRLSLDLVLIGPGLARYNLTASTGNNLSEADQEKFYEALNEALAEKFPGYNVILNGDSFKKSGVENTTSFGYRYMVQVGFRF